MFKNLFEVDYNRRVENISSIFINTINEFDSLVDDAAMELSEIDSEISVLENKQNNIVAARSKAIKISNKLKKSSRSKIVAKVTGIVEKVGNVRAGKNTFYNIVLVSDDTLYRTGFDQASVEAGDEVSFNYEDTKYGLQVDLKSLEVLSKGNEVSSKAPDKKKASKGEKSAGKDNYWEDKATADAARQNIISYQAAFNTATAIVTTAVNNGAAHVMGKTPNKMIPNLLGHVEELANEIFEKYLHGDSLAKELLDNNNKKHPVNAAIEEASDLDD